MERDFFKYLPSEMTTNILSRLPIRSLAISKSVCKPWLNLIDSHDFHKSEIKTPPALALLTPNGRDSTQCAIFEIEDEDEVDSEKSHDLHYIPLTDFDIPHRNRGFMEDGDLSILRDSLCYSYTHDNELVIWMMKEYQVEDSWTIEFKLSTIGFDFDYICVDLVKHFKDGNILMLLNETDLFYYSNKTRTFQRVGMFKDAAAGYLTALIFTPSLFSLKNFGFENVISF